MTANRFHTAYARQIARWLLRALSPDVTFFFSDREGTVLDYADDDIADFLGLPAAARRIDLGSIRGTMTDLLAELEATALPVGLPRRAEAGFEELAQYLGLAPAEAALATFLACARTEALVAGLQRLAWEAIADDPARYFSRVLALPLQEVADALVPEGRLFNSGLLDSGAVEWSAKTTPVFSAFVLAHQVMLECPILVIAHPLSNLWTMDEACFNGCRVPSFRSDRSGQMQRKPDWPDGGFFN